MTQSDFCGKEKKKWFLLDPVYCFNFLRGFTVSLSCLCDFMRVYVIKTKHRKERGRRRGWVVNKRVITCFDTKVCTPKQNLPVNLSTGTSLNLHDKCTFHLEHNNARGTKSAVRPLRSAQAFVCWPRVHKSPRQEPPAAQRGA